MTVPVTTPITSGVSAGSDVGAGVVCGAALVLRGATVEAAGCDGGTAASACVAVILTGWVLDAETTSSIEAVVAVDGEDVPSKTESERSSSLVDKERAVDGVADGRLMVTL
jgi:hypothetical protein